MFLTMECEFSGRISAAEMYFVIRKVKNLGGRDILSYSFHYPVSYNLSYYSSELFVQILDFCSRFPAEPPSQRFQWVSGAQEVSVPGPRGEAPFKVLTSALQPVLQTLSLSSCCVHLLDIHKMTLFPFRSGLCLPCSCLQPRSRPVRKVRESTSVL